MGQQLQPPKGHLPGPVSYTHIDVYKRQVLITSFMSTWNTSLWPMMVTNKKEMRTIQVGITMLNFADGNSYGPVMAASIIVLLPALLLFLVFRRQIVAGMMAGGVKE